MTDAVAVLRRLLMDEAAVQDLVGEEIFASEVPADTIREIKEQGGAPRKLIILSAAGGQEKRDTSLVIRPRLLIWCYGESYHEAGRLDLAVFELLETLERRMVDGVLVHCALPGYPTTVRDADSKWPAQQRTVTLVLSEEVA